MKNILIIDDDKMNLTMARKVLSDRYRVIPTLKGTQALAYLQTGDCDIILLDINMPEMNGFEVLKRIRMIEHCKDIPVIFLTADNDSETETRCFEEGALDYIRKPFVPEVMQSRVGRALELEELRSNLAKRLEQKTREVFDMKSKSCQDALTGLWNRVYTEETVNTMLSQGLGGTLMMIDLDNFKAINDNYGHITGDRTLKMFADTLQSFAREKDITCRIGGDEFIVFFKEMIDKDEVGNLAIAIISDLSNKLKECRYEINSSVSIGIAQAPKDGTEFDKLYNAADKALYHVKQNGKNSFHFFSDRLQEEKLRAEKNVDLSYIQSCMSRDDSGKGVYSLDFKSFQHVYNFIGRFIGRSKNEVQTLLFTINEDGENNLSVEELQQVLDKLEEAIYVSLRRSDISTRYSSRQIIVILMDTNEANGDMVAGRILKCFNELYTGSKVSIDYGIARMDG